jgi:hypothetical protein
MMRGKSLQMTQSGHLGIAQWGFPAIGSSRCHQALPLGKTSAADHETRPARTSKRCLLMLLVGQWFPRHSRDFIEVKLAAF